MNKNPYETSPLGESIPSTGHPSVAAGIGSRLAAYLIDAIPVTMIVAGFYWLFMGFDETWDAYVSSRSDIEARIAFLAQRNQIRDLAFLVYVIYSSVLESTSIQGTLGKRLIGIRVTDNDGNRLTVGRSVGRNFAKFISYVPLGLGFAWAIFSKRKRCWHDMIAKTLVVR